MVGYSRGAVIVATVAKWLNDEGCDCSHWEVQPQQQSFTDPCTGAVTNQTSNVWVWINEVYKPVPVHWIGLFDPVKMMGGNWATEFSPNVQSSSVAIRNPLQPGLHPQGGFQSIGPSGSTWNSISEAKWGFASVAYGYWE